MQKEATRVLHTADNIVQHKVDRMEPMGENKRFGSEASSAVRTTKSMILAGQSLRHGIFPWGKWWAHQDSNLGQTDYESATLTN